MKIKKENINFTQVSNELLLDKRVSAKAKGIYAYLYSRPDDWDFSVDRIANDFKDGYKAINGGIKELEELGYIAREKQTNGRNYYYIYQKPQKKAQPAKTASRQKGNQPKSLPGEKGGISNKDNINNTDIEIIKKDTKVSEVKTSSDTEIEKVEEFGNPIVNEIETAIKEACTEIGVLYIPGEKERQVLWNLWRSKVIKEIVEKRKELESVPDFIYKTIVLSKQDDFWNWKLFNGKTFKDNYGKFLNSFKGKKEADLKPKKVTTYG